LARQIENDKYEILTVRLAPVDMKLLKKAAEKLGIGHTVLARLLIRGTLRKEGSTRFPLLELSNLLSPLAKEKGLTEESLSSRVKKVRRKLWR